jgi:hypothetical protein
MTIHFRINEQRNLVAVFIEFGKIRLAVALRTIILAQERRQGKRAEDELK